ncbi:MAG: hypothetical protein AB7S42_00010 [Lysobacteraceae bacterium]
MRPALRHFAFAVLLVLLAACGAAREVTAPEDADAASAVAVAADSFEPDRPDAVRAPANDPMPPAAARKADAAAQQNDVGEVDYTCRSDADCAVKNVGNCCGYYPACVNVDSPTFPDQVKAACAASGTSSICGFPAISGCECVQERCEAVRNGFLREDGPVQ